MLRNANEKVVCQLTVTKPTIENVMAYTQYRQTQPRMKGLPLSEHNDLPILYGGGRDFLLGVLPSNGGDVQTDMMESTDLFVLNSCIIIWINAIDKGLQIPYQNIVYHGVRKMADRNPSEDGHALEIVITVLRDVTLNQLFPPSPESSTLDSGTLSGCSMSTVELILKPKYANHERHYNPQMENLFTFRDFGLNRGDTMVMNCNTAIATCMDFFCVQDESDEEDEQEQSNTATFTGVSSVLNDPAVYQNYGAADDLNDDDLGGFDVDEPKAGMALEFSAGNQLAGQKQTFRGSSGFNSSKKTRF